VANVYDKRLQLKIMEIEQEHRRAFAKLSHEHKKLLVEFEMKYRPLNDKHEQLIRERDA
jgi:hypothetical protein